MNQQFRDIEAELNTDLQLYVTVIQNQIEKIQNNILSEQKKTNAIPKRVTKVDSYK